MPRISSIALELSDTNVSNSLPDGLIHNETVWRKFQFSMTSADPSALNPSPLPSNLCRYNSSIPTIELTLRNMRLEGNLPNEFFSNCGSIVSLVFRGDNNNISGPFPNEYLLTTSTSSASFSFNSNAIESLSNEIPSKFNVSALATNMHVTLSLSNNKMKSFVNDSMFELLVSCGLRYLDASFNPELSGAPPYSSMGPYGGPMPEQLLHLGPCNFSGSLSPMPLAGRRTKCPIYFDVSSNPLLNGTIPRSWQDCNFYTGSHYLFDVSNNPDISGTIPERLFSTSRFSELSSRSVFSLRASNTSLSGLVPQWHAEDLLYSTIKYNFENVLNLDFCSDLVSEWNNTSTNASSNTAIPAVQRQPWPVFTWSTPTEPALIECNLFGTNICDCPEMYPSECTSFCYSEIVVPTMSPGCLGERPSAQFFCQNGTWTSNTSIVTPTFTIPPGGGTIVVIGNITSSTVVFQGLGTQLVVEGCAQNLQTVIVEELKKQKGDLRTLLTQRGANGANCPSLKDVNVVVKVKGGGCRTVKTDKTKSTRQSLNVAFSVDSSKCNLWWYILIPILVVVIILATIAAIIVGTKQISA